jgi:hypothetical protein
MRSFCVSLLTCVLILASRAALADGPPCSCLQELWADYPGPYDLYISLNKIVDCNDDEESLWYGTPYNNSLPQICESGNCQPYEDDDERFGALPGHGQTLVGTKAWEMFRAGIQAAILKSPGLEIGEPSYHSIARSNLPANVQGSGDLLVMAIPMTVHAKGSRIDGKTYFLCIQIDSAQGLPLTNATFEKGKAGAGSQFHITDRVKDEERKGLVWLK